MTIVVPSKAPDEFDQVRAVPGVAAEERRYEPIVAKLTPESLLGIYLAVHEEMDRRAGELRAARPSPGSKVGR